MHGVRAAPRSPPPSLCASKSTTMTTGPNTNGHPNGPDLVPADSGILVRHRAAWPVKAAPRPEPQAPPVEIDAQALLQAVRRRWLLVFGVATAAAVVTAAAAWAVVPAKFSARTLLHVSANRPAVLFDTGESRGDFGMYQRGELAMLKSRLVLRSALARPDVAALPGVQAHGASVSWLESKITADYSIAPEILRITMAGEQPDELLTLLNAVRDAYLQEIVNRDQTERRAKREQLEKLLGGAEADLTVKRKALRDRAETLGSRDPQVLALKHQFALQSINQLQSELLTVRTRLGLARKELTRADKDGALPPEEVAVEAAVAGDATVARLADDVRRLEAEVRFDPSRSVLGPAHPAVAGRPPWRPPASPWPPPARRRASGSSSCRPRTGGSGWGSSGSRSPRPRSTRSSWPTRSPGGPARRTPFPSTSGTWRRCGTTSPGRRTWRSGRPPSSRRSRSRRWPRRGRACWKRRC
jgi:hypothetical protein